MVVRTTRPSRGSEKRKTSVAVKGCRTDSAGIGRPCNLESERPSCAHGRARTKTWHGGGLCFSQSLRYPTFVATEIVLSYKLKLFPTRSKADTLALLAGLFRRLHAVATQSMVDMERPLRLRARGSWEHRP